MKVGHATQNSHYSKENKSIASVRNGEMIELPFSKLDVYRPFSCPHVFTAGTHLSMSAASFHTSKYDRYQAR